MWIRYHITYIKQINLPYMTCSSCLLKHQQFHIGICVRPLLEAGLSFNNFICHPPTSYAVCSDNSCLFKICIIDFYRL